MSEASSEAMQRAAKVRLVLLDADGVLTDGRLIMMSDGREARCFHVHDGQGIRRGQRAGLVFGIVSGRETRIVNDRAEELGITEVHQGVHDKAGRLEEILERLNLREDAVCFVGDDLVDVPVMRRVGFAAAPSDATAEARAAAHYVAERPGGRGAVREVVDLLLRAGDVGSP